MAYADFVTLDDSQHYASKHSGSAVEVVLIDESNPAVTVIGATTGINVNEDFEANPVEEAGNDGVDEIVQGRHSGSLTVPAFWTPEWNDRLPSRQNFIGRSFLILERLGKNRPGEGTVINAFTGCTLNGNGSSHGARGNKTLDLRFLFERRYNGQEWADLTGT